MRHFFLLLVLTALSCSAHAADVSDKASSPQKTAQHFYAWVLNNRIPFPTPDHMQALQPVLSPDLVQLLTKAYLLEQKCISIAAPDSKLPVFEGSIFVSNYEGADEVIVGTPKVHGKYATLPTRLFRVDERMPKAHPYRTLSWVDQLKLLNEHGTWLIRDIAFPQTKSLRTFLKDYISDNQSCWR